MKTITDTLAGARIGEPASFRSLTRRPPSVADAARFLVRINRARSRQTAALGEGEDVRLSGRALHGAALVKDTSVVHLAVFAAGKPRQAWRPSSAS